MDANLENFIKEKWKQVKELDEKGVEGLVNALVSLTFKAKKNGVEYLNDEYMIIKYLRRRRKLDDYTFGVIIRYASRCDEDKVKKYIDSYLYCKRHNF